MYNYNADGIRVEKVISGKETHKYLLEGNRIIREEILDKNGARKHLLWYNYDGNGQLASVEYDGAKYLYKVNQMGDVLGLYNTAGALVVKYRYDAWGKLLEIKNNNGLAITDPENVGLRNPFRYRGYYYDADTGFYYLNARYYDPETGRFINADGYASTGQGFVGSNMFAYCNNNPVMHIDPDGTFVISLTTVGVICLASLVTVLTVTAVSEVAANNTAITPISGPRISPVETNILVVAYIIDWLLNQSQSKADSSTDDIALPPPNTIFYEAYVLHPGAAVIATVPLTSEEAIWFILKGYDIWAPNLEYAMLITTAASGGFEGPERNGSQNAMHLHPKDRITPAHIFYGYGTNLEFFT